MRRMKERSNFPLLGLAFAGLALASAPLAAEPAPRTDPLQVVTPDIAHWNRLTRERAQSFVRVGLDWPVGLHRVVVDVTYDADGTITAQNLRVSSGHAAIDDGAMATLQRMQRLPQPPADISVAPGRMGMPFEFHIGSPRAIERWLASNARFNDPDRGVAFHLPAPLTVLAPRARPGHLWIVGIGTRAKAPPPVPGQSRVCDVGLQTQSPDWQGVDQAGLNGSTHRARLDGELRLGAGRANTASDPASLMFGTAAHGREIVVIPADRPDERHYLAVADTPQYRMTLTCATDAAHLERALPLFRAIADNLRIAPSASIPASRS